VGGEHRDIPLGVLSPSLRVGPDDLVKDVGGTEADLAAALILARRHRRDRSAVATLAELGAPQYSTTSTVGH
jgi:hypothetical protein